MPTITPTTAPKEATSLVDSKQFQEYKSSRSAMRLITDTGIKITFTNFRLLTQTKEAIEYLDKEIASGLPGITKGKLLTLDEVNPMETMRRDLESKIRKELAEEAKQAALGNTKDMGSYGAANLNPSSSKTVAK